jgi:predicted nucleic acid-binding protein
VTVVSDTSVLRYLVTLGQVDLLPRRFGKLLLPPDVADECRHAVSPAPCLFR